MQHCPDISFTDITEVYLQEFRRGKRVSLQSLAKKFPQFADRILSEIPLMTALEKDRSPSKVELPEIPQYQWVEELGRGSSGVVYKAKHASGKLVAIKLVRYDRGLANLGRLDREIESLSRLRHPHIVTIDSFGVCDDYLYIVTNLIEGITFSELLKPNPSVQAMYWISELRNDPSLLATWGGQVASALDYIHQNRIIHRDIKPSNLLIDRSGKCWIIDFGLAKVCESGMSVTQSNQIVGTPRFMAPEQLRGVVDIRCDLYSLGRTLYEIAAHDNDRTAQTSGSVPIAELAPSLATELGKIIDKACHPQPEMRYQSAKELDAVFHRFLDGKSPSDRRRVGKRMTEQEFKMRMRRRVKYAIAACLSCFMVMTAILIAPRFVAEPTHQADSVIHPQKPNASLKKLASAIEDPQSGMVEVIGEAIKHSVVSHGEDKATVDEITTKIDQIVQKVSTDGLKPGELDTLIDKYRSSPIMNANRIIALHHPLHNSTLNAAEKVRGHGILDLFAKAVVNKQVQADHADRLLASLFQGEIPKLEQIVSVNIPDQTLVAWLRLVESSFHDELRAAASVQSQSNEELKAIIDGFLQQHAQ